MRIGVVTFPGSNCDADCRRVLTDVLGFEVRPLWHKDAGEVAGLDAVVLPGGFSYGDYLRSGALARFSPVMADVARFVASGGPVLGICNGFQILTEAGLLPGALLRNAGLRFVCRPQALRVEGRPTPWTRRFAPGAAVTMPIAHGDGRYHADAETLARLEGDGRVVFRYVAPGGAAGPLGAASPNGSVNDIAGVADAAGRVVGLMPHPERVCESLLGGTDGRAVFESLLGA